MVQFCFNFSINGFGLNCLRVPNRFGFKSKKLNRIGPIASGSKAFQQSTQTKSVQVQNSTNNYYCCCFYLSIIVYDQCFIFLIFFRLLYFLFSFRGKYTPPLWRGVMLQKLCPTLVGGQDANFDRRSRFDSNHPNIYEQIQFLVHSRIRDPKNPLWPSS